MIWTDGDAILKHSLLMTGTLLDPTTDPATFRRNTMHFIDMEYQCRLDNWFGHRKSPTYRWSNSGSENPSENTLLKRPTWWLYHNSKLLIITTLIIQMIVTFTFPPFSWVPVFLLAMFFIRVSKDPFKGANFDQLRAYWITLYIRKERWIAFKHLIAFIPRMGFAPSLMENVIFKPQSLVVLLATIWNPLKYLVWVPFKISAWKNLNKPIKESTTNKISLIATLILLSKPKLSREYISNVYRTYFCEFDNKIVGNTMIRGLSAYLDHLERGGKRI